MNVCRNRVFIEFVVDEVDVNIVMLLGNLSECIGKRSVVEAVAELLRKGNGEAKHHRNENNKAFHFTVNTLLVSVMLICSKLFSCPTTS